VLRDEFSPPERAYLTRGAIISTEMILEQGEKKEKLLSSAATLGIRFHLGISVHLGIGARRRRTEDEQRFYWKTEIHALVWVLRVWRLEINRARLHGARIPST